MVITVGVLHFQPNCYLFIMSEPQIGNNLLSMCKMCIKINVIDVSSRWSEKAGFVVQVVTFLSVPGSQKSVQLSL